MPTFRRREKYLFFDAHFHARDNYAFMKNIQWLNEKWWYRLIKVIYIILFSCVLIISTVGLFIESNPKIDNDKSFIQCANGKKFILSQNDLRLYSEFMYSTDKEKAETLCFDGSTELKKSGERGIYIPVSERSEMSGKYELITKNTERNWPLLIGIILVVWVIIYFVFELLRRIFYYILLGKLFPTIIQNRVESIFRIILGIVLAYLVVGITFAVLAPILNIGVVIIFTQVGITNADNILIGKDIATLLAIVPGIWPAIMLYKKVTKKKLT